MDSPCPEMGDLLIWGRNSVRDDVVPGGAVVVAHLDVLVGVLRVDLPPSALTPATYSVYNDIWSKFAHSEFSFYALIWDGMLSYNYNMALNRIINIPGAW